jgi:hypothetical protein
LDVRFGSKADIGLTVDGFRPLPVLLPALLVPVFEAPRRDSTQSSTWSITSSGHRSHVFAQAGCLRPQQIHKLKVNAGRPPFSARGYAVEAT